MKRPVLLAIVYLIAFSLPLVTQPVREACCATSYSFAASTRFVDPPRPPLPAALDQGPKLDLDARKNWTPEEKLLVTEIFRKIESKAPGLLIRAAAYLPITLYRANFSAGEGPIAFATLGGENSITFADPFFSSSAPSYSLLTESVLIHELTHLADYGETIASSADWKRLAGTPCDTIRNKILETRNLQLTYALSNDQSKNLQTEFVDFAHRQGMPSVYSCVSLSEALAENAAYAITTQTPVFSPTIGAFVEQQLFTQDSTPQALFRDYFDAILLEEAGKTDEALASFSRLIDQYPEFYALYSGRAKARIIKGDASGAISDNDKAIQGELAIHDSFNAARDAAWKAKVFMTRNDYSGAETAYTQAIGYLPGWTEYLFERARLRLDNLSNPRAAISDCDEILKKRPESVPTLLLRAKAFGRIKDYAKQDADYSKAIELAPGFAENYLFRALARIARGMLQEAVDDYTVAIAIQEKTNPTWYGTNSLTYYQRGQVLGKMGRYADAVADYTASIQLSRKWAPFPVAGYNGARGIAYVEMGEYAKGLEDLRIGQRDPSLKAVFEPWVQKATEGLAAKAK